MLEFERGSSPCADEESGEAAGTKDDGARFGAGLLREESDEASELRHEQRRMGGGEGHGTRGPAVAQVHGAGWGMEELLSSRSNRRGAGWAIGENEGGRWVRSRGRRREWTRVAAARMIPRN